MTGSENVTLLAPRMMIVRTLYLRRCLPRV
jgi:hypothetical protein